MHALEAIGMEAGAVLFLPDDFLCDAQAGVGEAVGGRHEASQRAEHPQRAGRAAHRERARDPAVDPPVPGE